MCSASTHGSQCGTGKQYVCYKYFNNWYQKWCAIDTTFGVNTGLARYFRWELGTNTITVRHLLKLRIIAVMVRPPFRSPVYICLDIGYLEHVTYPVAFQADGDIAPATALYSRGGLGGGVVLNGETTPVLQ